MKRKVILISLAAWDCNVFLLVFYLLVDFQLCYICQLIKVTVCAKLAVRLSDALHVFF